jgi:hypothetical protein
MPGHELWAALKPEKVTTVFVPVILGTQLFRGIEHSSLVHTLEENLHSNWLLYGLLLIASIIICYGFIQVAGDMSFGQLKNNGVKKAELFIHAVIPLAFAFEFVYQLKPLLTRLGTFFPVLGRQIGIDLEWFSIAASPGIVKFWQVVFLVGGMILSYLFLQILMRKHQEENTRKFVLSGLKWLPVFSLAALYIWMFATGQA